MAGEEALVEMQKLAKKLEAITLQRMQMESQINEFKTALEVLKEEKPEKVYKSVGNVIVEVEREKVESELKKAISFLEERVKKMKAEEEELKKEFMSYQKQLGG